MTVFVLRCWLELLPGGEPACSILFPEQRWYFCDSTELSTFLTDLELRITLGTKRFSMNAHARSQPRLAQTSGLVTARRERKCLDRFQRKLEYN